MSKRSVAYFLILLSLFVGTGVLHAEEIEQKEHGLQANGYLELLDQGRYQDAWQTMSPLFWSLHIQQEWQQRISAIRKAYGPVISRDFTRSSYRSSYRNAPDGEYLIFQFDTVFTHKAKGVETIVLQCSPTNVCVTVDYVIN